VSSTHGKTVVLAGLIEDGSAVSLSSLKFLVDLACTSSVPDARVLVHARRGSADLFAMAVRALLDLHPHPHLSCPDGEGRLDIRPEPDEDALREMLPDEEGEGPSVSNRIDRIAALREVQRREVAAYLDANDLTDEEVHDTVIVVADLDVAFLPPASQVVDTALNMLSNQDRVKTKVDVVCSAGVEAHGGYYDTFATVLLPDTFVYDANWRLNRAVRPEEDASMIVGGGYPPFTNWELLRWFDRVAAERGGSVPVKSCFGGLALYRAERWLDDRCGYVLPEEEEERSRLVERYANFEGRPCEHVVFNSCLRDVDPLTSIEVRPDLRPMWHVGDGSAVRASSNLDDLAGGGEWNEVERRLRESVEAGLSHGWGGYGRVDGTICPPGWGGGNSTNLTMMVGTGVGNMTNGTMNGTMLGCCWDSLEEINKSEMEWNGTLCLGGGNVTVGNGTLWPNGTWPNMTWPNATWPNMTWPNMTWPNATNCTHYEGVRTYVLCPNTLFQLDDGDTGLNVTKPNVTFQCGFNSTGDNNCTIQGGFVHVHVRANVTNPIGNVTVRGVTSVDAGDYNILAEGINGPNASGTVSFENCTFKDGSGNYGIVRHLYTDPFSRVGDKSLELSFDNCTFADNENTSTDDDKYPSSFGIKAMFLAANAALSFRNSSFVNNFVPYFGEGIARSALVAGSRVKVLSNAFVSNDVGNAMVIAALEREDDGRNVYIDNVYQSDNVCVDCIMGAGGECYCNAEGEPVGPDLEEPEVESSEGPGADPTAPEEDDSSTPVGARSAGPKRFAAAGAAGGLAGAAVVLGMEFVFFV